MEELKIIIVDDSEEFRKVLKALLLKEYHAVIIGEASNADEFWKIKEYHLADIILMDVIMPITDGITLARQILIEDKTLKIIAVTLHSDKVYLKTLVETGFRGCLFKNNLFNELSIALNDVMNGKQYFPNNILLL